MDSKSVVHIILKTIVVTILIVTSAFLSYRLKISEERIVLLENHLRVQKYKRLEDISMFRAYRQNITESYANWWKLGCEENLGEKVTDCESKAQELKLNLDRDTVSVKPVDRATFE